MDELEPIRTAAAEIKAHLYHYEHREWSIRRRYEVVTAPDCFDASRKLACYLEDAWPAVVVQGWFKTERKVPHVLHRWVLLIDLDLIVDVSAQQFNPWLKRPLPEVYVVKAGHRRYKPDHVVIETTVPYKDRRSCANRRP